jgi:uncharacterized protein (TIGR02246 family)
MKFCSIILLAVMLGCGGGVDKDKEDVRAVVAGILDADNHADLERVLSYYREDAVLMPPGKEEIRGIESIRSNYENIFETSMLDLSPEEEELVVENQLAVFKGRTKGKVILKSDSATRLVNDKFVMILKQQDGTWRISTLIWN